MAQAKLTVPRLLDKLERFYGPQEPSFPVDPFEFLVWWYCGYPASDKACGQGWDKLKNEVGIEPDDLLEAPPRKLAESLKPGGMFPDLRAQRLKEVAMRVKDQFGGDLRAGLVGPIVEARKTLKEFPSIADPGADRILLFAGISPIAAVPSNCVHVLARILCGKEGKNYGASYRAAQNAIAAAVPENFDARTRAYLLLKRHGPEVCKSTKPKCEGCPVNASCAFFAKR